MITLQEILIFAESHRACEDQLTPFKKFIETGDELSAWQTVNGNLTWLSVLGLALDINKVSRLAKGQEKRWHKNGQLSFHKTPAGEEKKWFVDGTLFYHKTPNGEEKEWYENVVLVK